MPAEPSDAARIDAARIDAALIDSGLLSPVRAGTPAEAAVGDAAWLAAMLDAEAALARSQARLGTVPPGAAEVITAQARAEHFDLRALALASRETANPVVGLVKALTERVAGIDEAAAQYVHRGSTSQDIFDTAAMLVARRALTSMSADLRRSIDALAGLAGRHRDTVMAGRTLALHAVPTTFGLKAAGWRKLLLDADRRLRAVAEALPVSLGGAAGTLSGYLEYAALEYAGSESGHARAFDPGDYVDRLTRAFAEETGLACTDLPWHALRTPIADLVGAVALTAGALGKIAVDVQALCRTEVGELAEPAVAGRGGSSAMPHKANPVLATLIRSAALQVPLFAAAATQCMLAEDERSAGAWHAEWLPVRECLRLTGGAAHTAVELCEGLDVRVERMTENLGLTGGQIVSERIAAALAPRLGKVEAKSTLTRASLEARRRGLPLLEVLAEQESVTAVFGPQELADLCDPARYTAAAGPLVDRALKAVADA